MSVLNKVHVHFNLTFPCSLSSFFSFYLLISGSKQDSWIAVDALTGRKLYSFSSHDGLNAMCPPNQYGGSRIIHIPTIGKLFIFILYVASIITSINYT